MFENKSLVSVIVPCYNQGEFLSETLDSVLSQTYTHWECIIVNDGSTDNTHDVAHSYCEKDERFRYVEQINRGLSSARNYGLNFVSGDFIQFLDSDDIILPNKFEIQHEIMLQDHSIDFCISKYKLFTNDIQSPFDSSFTRANFNTALNSFLYEWGEIFTIAIHSYLIRRKFLLKNNIKFNESLSALEDWQFIVEATLKNAKYFVVEQNLALYRQHSQNMTFDFSRMSKSLIEASISIYDILPPQKKMEYRNKISSIIIKRLMKSFGKRENTIEANSIDYKVGYILLFPFHKVLRFIKKINKSIK